MYSARGRAELKQLRYLDSSLGTATCCDWSSDRLNCFLGVDDITLSIGLGNAEATLLRQRLQYSTTKKKGGEPRTSAASWTTEPETQVLEHLDPNLSETWRDFICQGIPDSFDAIIIPGNNVALGRTPALHVKQAFDFIARFAISIHACK